MTGIDAESHGTPDRDRSAQQHATGVDVRRYRHDSGGQAGTYCLEERSMEPSLERPR
jgi:hypothetical protein